MLADLQCRMKVHWHDWNGSLLSHRAGIRRKRQPCWHYGDHCVLCQSTVEFRKLIYLYAVAAEVRQFHGDSVCRIRVTGRLSARALTMYPCTDHASVRWPAHTHVGKRMWLRRCWKGWPIWTVKASSIATSSAPTYSPPKRERSVPHQRGKQNIKQTNKQTSKQANKQTNKQENKQT